MKTTHRFITMDGEEIDFTTGFTDLHYFVEEAKIPGVGYGVRGSGAHGANERVRISDLIKCAKIYALFMVGARL